MKSGTINTTSEKEKCILWISDSAWISYDSNATFAFTGKVHLNQYLESALYDGLTSTKSLKSFKFVSGNQLPTTKVRYCCHDIPLAWSCERRAAKCRLILRTMATRTLIATYRLKESYITDMLFEKDNVRAACKTSTDFLVYYEGNKVTCVGPDNMFAIGKQFCQKFIDCIDKAFKVLTDYTKESAKCLLQNGPHNDTSSLQYGVQMYFGEKFEFVKKTISANEWIIPSHFILKCSGKQAFFQIIRSRDFFSKESKKNNYALCLRDTKTIWNSYPIIPDCWQFIAECSKAFDCLERQKVCHSDTFGQENESGFLVDKFVTLDQIYAPSSCLHWGVELMEEPDGHIYCSALRLFKINNFPTFCQSFDWVCTQIIRCFQTREMCHYHPNRATNFTTLELRDLGLYNIHVPRFAPRENPRKVVTALFQCNKKYGHGKRVFVYFITSFCPRGSPGCQLDMSPFQDEYHFEIAVEKSRYHLSRSSPAMITEQYKANQDDLLFIWSCKRDGLSATTCAEFLQTCDQITTCLSSNGGEKEGISLPPDSTCFSPLPVSTINPLPEVESAGHTPGMLGPSITFVMPLEKSYPRLFHRLFFTGYEYQVNDALRERRTNLFFNVFLEDCRWKHQFEGFLVEPYLTETVDYLLCSISFGLAGYGENPLVTQGCSRMQEACENMKQCYVHHAKYFKFHSFFNDNIFPLALIMMMIFFLSPLSLQPFIDLA